LIAGALTSSQALAFLEGLPAPESMLPAFRLTPELDAAVRRPPRLLRDAVDVKG
jgi:hypothetical protein